MIATIEAIARAILVGIAVLFLIGLVLSVVWLVAVIIAMEKEDEQKRQEELPWTCLILFGECPNPKMNCSECEIFENYQREERNHDHQNFTDTEND